MKKRWASLFLAVFLTFSFTSLSFADTVKDKQDQLQESKDSINEIKDQIDDVKDKKEDLLGELNKIEAQVDKVQDDIADIRKQIDSTKKNVQSTTKELDKAVKEYDQQRELYENRVKAIYINGPSGYLEIILSSDGFSDFFTRMDMVKTIIEYDRNVLKEMVDKQEKINKKKVLLESEQRKLISLEKGLGSKKAELDLANASKKKYYNKLNGDLVALKKALDDEIAESNAIAEEIKKLTTPSGGGNGGNFSGSKTGILRISDIGHTPRISSPFGMRWHPVLQEYKMHTGIDIAIPSGTPVYAMSSGKIIISKYSSSYGNYIVIDHGGGITSLYAHNSQRLVSVGQSVEKGQMISKSGSTGRSTGPHLHFEVRSNGTPIDPMPYYILGK